MGIETIAQAQAASAKADSSSQDIEEKRKDHLHQKKMAHNMKAVLGFGETDDDLFLQLTRENVDDPEKWAQLSDVQQFIAQLKENEQELFAESLCVEELNKTHAVLAHADFRILTEYVDPLNGEKRFYLGTKQSFLDRYENQCITNSKGKQVSKATVWLKSPERRQYEGFQFEADPAKVKPHLYNLWTGFKVTPSVGDCSMFLQHIYQVLCCGNEEKYEYFLNWCARMFQYPSKPAETAIVLKGVQGAGKNTVVDALMKVFGSHGIECVDMEQLFGKFNEHLNNKILISGNEAMWGGYQKNEGRVKAMITDKYRMIEAKGQNAYTIPNCVHLIMMSNDKWPVRIEASDRRFVVMNVSDCKVDDFEYFAQLNQELESGGLQAFLWEMMNRDISDFVPMRLPLNNDAFEVKMRSATPHVKYLYECLCAGSVDIGNATPSIGWQEGMELTASSLFVDFQCYHPLADKLRDLPLLCDAMKEYVTGVKGKRKKFNGVKLSYWTLPSLEECRERFAKAHKSTTAIFDDGACDLDHTADHGVECDELPY